MKKKEKAFLCKGMPSPIMYTFIDIVSKQRILQVE